MTHSSRSDVVQGPAYRIYFKPEEDLGRVILKACWVADNGVETASFSLRELAVRFAAARWGPYS